MSGGGWSYEDATGTTVKVDHTPKRVVVLNDLAIPLSRPVLEQPGEVQALTPSIEALYVPNIDQALDEESAKRAFWSAFRVVGEWYADLPPY